MMEQQDEIKGTCIRTAGLVFENAAEFVGKWLLSASAIDKMWKEVCKDKEFAGSIERLRVVYEPDVGVTAMGFVTPISRGATISRVKHSVVERECRKVCDYVTYRTVRATRLPVQRE